jgi:serine/threonine protein kinase/Tfp pilus assembly protein PilF
MVGKRVFQYQILEKLGQGGMGEVFLAEDTELHRNVALKFLPSSSSSDAHALDRFKQEARSAAALNHPNITTIYEIGVWEDRPYIAMAYVDGEKLTDLIGDGGADFNRALDVVIQICDGLGKAHDAGIIHRDIKPDNILLDRDGRAKILDFGIAKLKGVSQLPSEISTLGTAYYMSPEQISGEETDHRSDVFSLGVVLYELVTGRRPFKGEHTSAVFYSITNEEPAPLEAKNLRQYQSEALHRIVLKALEKNPDNRYQAVGELREDLARLREGTHKRSAERRSRRRRTALLAPVLVALVAVAIIVFKPLKLDISRDAGAIAAQNTLAVMYFENLVDSDDPERLGEIVTNLVITDLSGSGELQVVSSQRLYDLLKQEGKEDAKVIDKSTATAIADRAGARWMMLGSILQTEPEYMLTTQLVDVTSGNVVASQRITSSDGETIFQLVDRMSEEVRGDLASTGVQLDKDETEVASVTTHSVEAYRAYIIGMEKENKYFMDEARRCYRKAVELDSTFAMAYLGLSQDRVAGTYSEKKYAIDQAVRHAERTSKKEMLYIKNAAAAFRGDATTAIAGYETLTELFPEEKKAYIQLGRLYRDSKYDMDKARAAFEKVIEIDPLDKNAYNNLAYLYNFIGEFEKSIWAINQYINLAPEEPNPYDSRADLYAYNGRLEDAEASYSEALRRKPDFYPSMVKLGHMALFQEDYEQAEGRYKSVGGAADDDFARWGLTCLAFIPIYKGDFTAALDGLERQIERDRADGYGGWAYLQKLFARSYIHAALGEHSQAIATAETYRDEYRRLRPSDDEWWRLRYGFLMYYCDETETSAEMLGAFLASIDSLNEAKMMGYATLKGLLAMKQGRHEAACSYLERANRNMKFFTRRFWLGRVYLEADRPRDAMVVFEDLLDQYSEDRADAPLIAVSAWYYAGLASDRSGEIERARSHYARFLRYWGEARPQPQLVAAARQRLAALSTDI